MADKWDSEPDEQALGTEEIRGVANEDDEFEDTEDLDDADAEEDDGSSTF